MSRRRPALFRGPHFEDVIILLCVRWCLRYSLTYRDLEEMMAERNLSVDHVTIWRWVQRLRAGFESANAPRTPPPQSVLEGRRNVCEGVRPLGLPVSRRRFCWRDNRVHVVAKARLDRREAVPTARIIRRRTASASDQRRWSSGIRQCGCRIEADQ